MLEKISIQGPATFVDEVVLDNLPEVNFIYGANGSGKTTISNVIMNPSMYDRVSLEWKGGITTRALVYNKQFREQNFAPGVLPGVFTLGKATKEQLNEVENYRDELSRIKEEGIKKKTTLEKLQEDQATLKDEFSREMWKSAKKKYESVFNEAFKGNVKSMESFCDKVLAESDTNISELSDYDILIEESKVLLSQTPLLLVALPDFPDVKIRDIESSSLWQKVIVGSNDVPIAKMIQRLNMSDWVNEGKNYLNDDSDVCPFCQQHTIDAEFKSQLDLFFDQEYLNSLHDLSELIGAYQYASDATKPNRASQRHDFRHRKRLHRVKFHKPLLRAVHIHQHKTGKETSSSWRDATKANGHSPPWRICQRRHQPYCGESKVDRQLFPSCRTSRHRQDILRSQIYGGGIL